LYSHPAYRKAASYLERLLILAPKNPNVYRLLASMYEDQRNLKGLRDLAARVDKAALDLSDEEKQTREHWAGKRDDKERKDLQAQLDSDVKLVETTGKGQRGVTYAVAATDLVSRKMGLDDYGVAVDAGEVVALAESAYAAAPSDGTRRMLESALLFRASRSLAKKDPAFAALLGRLRRSVDTMNLLAALMGHDSETRQAVLADADVKRCVDLMREARRKFPDSPNSWAWAMLRATDKDEVAKLAQVIGKDNLEPLTRALNLKLSPLSTGTALHSCWSLQAAGKDEEAKAIFKQYKDRAVPLPDAP
jgi:hypothetical protein